MFNGQSILITGGTGSFGQGFVRTVLARYTPRRLIVFSRDELKQSEMDAALSHPALRFFIGDVRDAKRLCHAMRDVDYVVHAAALKQVPAAEYNPMECIKTNVYGAENVIHAAIENAVKKVIALSTDKAANPINLYGTSKLASDKLFIAGNNIAGGRPTRFAVVRYGNVVGSRGSVVPVFRDLLARGEHTLPITDRRMTRFWITLQQGVDFVLEAFQRVKGGEIFVPKIPSARIVDIAAAMAPDSPLQMVGKRPGEKLHEVMCPAEMSNQVIEFEDYYTIRPAIKFFDGKVDYYRDANGETGRPVADGFEYESGTNPRFLSIPELERLLAPWISGVSSHSA